MRAREFLSEASALTLGKVTKSPGRVEKFIDLIQQGHQFNSALGPVQLDTAQIPYLQSVLQKTNVGVVKGVNVKTLDGQTIPLGKLHFDQTAWNEFGKGGDATTNVKPGAAFQHGNVGKGQEVTADLALQLGAFPASQLANKIVNNEYIRKQGAVGEAVIQITKQINSEQLPDVPSGLPKKAITSIQNDAFEYLGILELIKGIADFPNGEAFYEHLGTDLTSMLLFFPGAANNPLTDSYALQSENKNSIFISSKGGKKAGAPSSIKTLKIPVTVAEKDDETIAFLKLIHGTKEAWKQPFVTANFIKELSPGKLGELEPFVPFTDDIMNYMGMILAKRNKGVPTKLEQIPEEHREFFELVQRNTKSSSFPLFLNARNYVKDNIVGPAINNKNAIPGFNDTMLEILGYNFIVLNTKISNNKFITTVKWPSQMGGKITFQPKDGADKWDSSMTWKLN
jgi:hypothetical protein